MTNANEIISKLETLSKCNRNGKTVITDAISTIKQQQKEIERYKKALEKVAYDADAQFFERCQDIATKALEGLGVEVDD